MDLRKFYMKHVKENEFHYFFYDFIKNINIKPKGTFGYIEQDDYDFEIFDDESAIAKFKELCQPEMKFNNSDDVCWFYLITYYLYKRGYEIKEFPRILARPYSDPIKFTYNEIRSKILSNGGGFNGTVPFRDRRALINDLTFQQKNLSLELDDSIEKLFVAISNRQAFFNDMSTNEKLASISNLIENMLKVDGKFIKLDYSKICFDYISDDDIKRYRKKLNCFRHGSNESINERKTYSDEQKKFLIDYGLIIVKTIRYLTKQ
ncbi:hypothetical protein AKUH4B101A_10330 [Apilactobacillus kunkeei]|uniref:hypothetical protein n=1 Tax=Apilactobacillus waqarii TaxID=2851006 RepID=UPI00220A4DC1|nr:hypothetical protein AKUH4B103J_10330 [Apilactobacillus kunkeei]CAI2623423.1 hypothetical protein AKUH4B403J_10290 [Apilactobacillus kunkeei]CAI2624119.1 hypothetical protein AKUH4B203M_10290 [Apilactobacillus kunkeei]CAI2626818.1 hypothetical protein AKUH4B303J_10490 [Apilactobacillus kunkeei]CAI2626902.1 hypothetical protein AKUH4B404J_10290 [Apilactobacillus kunkeei]